MDVFLRLPLHTDHSPYHLERGMVRCQMVSSSASPSAILAAPGCSHVRRFYRTDLPPVSESRTEQNLGCKRPDWDAIGFRTDGSRTNDVGVQPDGIRAFLDHVRLRSRIRVLVIARKGGGGHEVYATQ